MITGALVIIVVLGLVLGLGGFASSAVRHRSAGAGLDPRSVRRFFQYLILFALVIVFAVGAAELIGRLLGARPEGWEDSDYQLAQAWSFVVVGAPAAGLLGWYSFRQQRSETEEHASAWAAVYVTLMSLVALVAAAVSLQGVLRELLGELAFDADAAGALLVWGAVWFVHWAWARWLLADGRDGLHILGGSLVGLALAAGGAIYLLGSALDVLILRTAIIGSPALTLAEAGAVFASGAAVWAWYWLLHGARRPRETIWLTLVLLFGVGGGLVVGLVAGTMLLWSVLVWFLGEPATATAAHHFASAPTQLAALVIGAVLWWYHRTILGQVTGRPEVRRVYEYLVAGLALVASAAGVGTVVVALLEAVTPGVDIGMSMVNTLLAAVTLLLVGTPVWWLHWAMAQRAYVADPPSEASSPSRRVYLAVVLGVSAIAAIVALIMVAFTVIQDLIAGQLGLATLRSIRYGLGVLLAAAAVALYHAVLVRGERALSRATSSSTAVPRSVLLIGWSGADVTRDLGAPITAWRILDEEGPQWDPEALAAALDGHAGQDVVVVPGPDGPRAFAVDKSG